MEEFARQREQKMKSLKQEQLDGFRGSEEAQAVSRVNKCEKNVKLEVCD